MNRTLSTRWWQPRFRAAMARPSILLALCLAFVAPAEVLASGSGPAEKAVEVAGTAPAGLTLAAVAQTLPVSCGASGFLGWTTVSIDGEIVRQCTLTVPSDGSLFISADGSLVNWDGPYGVRLWVNVDSTANDPGTTRWVDVYDDADDGTDKSIATSVLKPVTAGTHTVYVVASRWGGTGTVMIRDPSLSAIFLPAAGSELLTCGDSGPGVWFWTSSVAGTIRQCTLQIPQNGVVFLSADATAAYADGDYEGEFRFGVDASTGDKDTQRWVDVYSDAGDGTDEQLAMSSYRVVGPGEHTFYLVGMRTVGTGTVTLWNPSLTAIYIPALGSDIVTCMQLEQLWTSTDDAPSVVAECAQTLPRSGWAFISADGSLAQSDGSYEAQFGLQIDDPDGDLGIDRWVDVYTDTADGTDKSLRVSALTPVEAGEHDFRLMGRRSGSLNTAMMMDVSLSVLVLPSPLRVYLPLVRR